MRGNTANSNGQEFLSGDGIRVLSPSTVIGGNTTNSNYGHGINAVAGVRDHGGNTAIGNGNPVQCVNVFCSRP